MRELIPALVRRRRRNIAGAAVAVVLLVQLAMFAIARRSPAERTYLVHPTTIVEAPTVVPFTAPMIIQLAAPPPSAPEAALPACPPERTDAPQLVPPDLDRPIERVRAAPSNAGWIAAWSELYVYVSTDAGAHFTRVLDGEGDVHDVTFDCFGRALVLRGTQVGILETDGTEHWHAIPGIHLVELRDDRDLAGPYATLVGGGPEIVAVARPAGDERDARIARSRDGASWAYHDVTSGGFEGLTVSGRQHADGTIEVALVEVDCMSEEQAWVEIRRGRMSVVRHAMSGTEHAIARGIAINRGRTRHRNGAWQPIRMPAGVTDELLPLDAPTPMVLAGTTAYRLSHERTKPAKALPWHVAGDAITVDPAGPIWSVVCGRAWIAHKRPAPYACEEG